VRLLTILLILLSTLPLQAEKKTGLDAVLDIGIENGEVDYRYLKSKKGHLEQALGEMASANLLGMDQNAKMVHWINAYNLCTLKLIIDNYPLKSIKEISRSKRWVWKGFLFGTEKLSLDQIEHEKLRPMGDPRIHFAINCASKSCPPLIPRLFKVESLEEDLDQVTRRFLADQVHGAKWKTEKSFLGWGEEKKVLYLSKIFSWFKEDFVKHSGSVLSFVKPYLSENQRAWLEGMDDDDLHFLSYDWSLNGR
jgi:hypothetical protein